MDDVRNKINQTLQWLLFFTIPMAFGLSVLAKPVWTVFYGASEFGPSVYQYYVFVALATTLFTASITILQLLKEYKRVFVGLLTGLLTNALLNIPLLYGFHKMGLPAYYGSITSTILGYLACSIMSLHYIGKKYKVNYEDTLKKVFNILISTLFMVIVLLVVKHFIPFTSTSRLVNIVIIAIYALIGASIYLAIMFKTKLIYQIFGKDNVDKLISRFKKKK